MDKEQKDVDNKMPVVQQAAEYLEKHQIYALFTSLMSSLAINRPRDPKQFVIQQLTSDEPFRVCVISNNKDLSVKCCNILSNHFNKTKIHEFEINDDEIEKHIKVLQSEKNFILHNYPTNKIQALSLLDSRVIPDRIFLLTNEIIDELDNNLISLSNVFKHNTRIICVKPDDNDNELKLEKRLLSSYYSQKTNLYNYLSPTFSPRIAIFGPPNIGKTKLSLYLHEKLNLYYLNPKHVLNQHIKLHTTLGIEAEKHLNVSQDDNIKNKIIPNDIITKMIANDISNDKDILNNGYILDNFPRNMEQAQLLIKYGVRPNRIIVLNVNDSVSIEKCKDNTLINDNIQTHGITPELSKIAIYDLLDGYKENIKNVVSVLCDPNITIKAGVSQFDVERYEWERLLELALDFIVQPLPKLQ